MQIAEAPTLLGVGRRTETVNEVAVKVLVLVVAPHEHDVRVELIERGAHAAQPVRSMNLARRCFAISFLGGMATAWFARRGVP